MSIRRLFSLGIVGHAEDKFTLHSSILAKSAIIASISKYAPTRIISGGCHLGGVDIWAEEAAKALSIPLTVYKPSTLSWSEGYKPRNLLIANNSNLVVCIVARNYPPNYSGLRFPFCYHCSKRTPLNSPHIKSGGCWTAWKCRNREWIYV